MPTPVDLDELENKMKVADISPLRAWDEDGCCWGIEGTSVKIYSVSKHTADLIVTAINTLPSMIEELRRLRAYVARTKTWNLPDESFAGWAIKRHRDEAIKELEV